MQKLTLVGTEIKDFKFHFGVLEIEKAEKYHGMILGQFLKTFGDGLTTKITMIWVGISRFQPKYTRDDVALMIDSFVEQGGDTDILQTAILKELEDFGLRSGKLKGGPVTISTPPDSAPTNS